MGGSFWWVRHPWRGDLGATLDEARQVAFTALPAPGRAAADTPTSDLLRRLDVDPDQRRRWRRWLETAPAATRYVLARHPGGMGTVLDVDHVERPSRPTRPPPVDAPAGTRILVPPAPGLGGMRLATAEEYAECFGTDSPSDWEEEHADWWADHLDGSVAVAVVLGGGDAVLCGVTGD